MLKNKSQNDNNTHSDSEAFPKILGRYKIINEVGRGATAFVFKAYDPQLDRFLALKVLRKQLSQDNDYKNAFIKEARLAAQLTHPGIVTIYDVGIADDNPYIAMELLEGLTLEQVLKAQGKLNLRTLLAMSIQLAKALSYAHEQNVVHRDIKPANIIILNDRKTVKLTDFGIAQINENLNIIGKSSDKVLGTPEYMPPEQILGQATDNRSDLYSFGVLMFQMLMGLPPFVSDDLGKLFTQIIKSKPPTLLIDEDKVKDDLRDLINKLLQKQPIKRYQNAILLNSELHNIQNKLRKNKKNKNQKFVSLSFRWTATMASVVLITMCISLAVVYFVQNKALSDITFEHRRSTTELIAEKIAVPIAFKDLIGLKIMVDESAQNEQLKNIFVINVDNVVLASTQAETVGKVFSPPVNRKLKQLTNETSIYQRQLDNGEVLFDVDVPIDFSDKHLGSLYISYSTNSMYNVSKTTLIWIFTVMLITFLVIFIVTLTLARRTSKDFQRITQALNKVAKGRLDARLMSERKDEAGQMFSAFNRLASYFERHLTANSSDSISKNITKMKKSANSVNQSIAETIELNIISQDDSSNQEKE